MKALFISPSKEVLKDINNVPRQGDVIFIWGKHWSVDVVIWVERSGEDMVEVHLSRNAYVATLDDN